MRKILSPWQNFSKRESKTFQALLLQVYSELWQQGVAVSWKEFAREKQFRRVPLPTYPFEREYIVPNWVPPTVVMAVSMTLSFS